MDRNQAIGLVLFTLIMMGYFMYMGNQEQKIEKPVTTEKVEKKETVKDTSDKTTTAPVLSDSLARQTYGELGLAANGEEKTDTLGNENIQVTFNSKGGIVERVWLKQYFTDDKKPLYIIDKQSSRMSYLVATSKGEKNLSDLYYASAKTDSTITYKADLGGGKFIEHRYTLPKKGFIVNYKFRISGLGDFIQGEHLKFLWTADLPKLEKDLESNRVNSTVNYYYTDGEFDYINEKSKSEEYQKLDRSLKWVSLKQKFFTSGIIAQNKFDGGYAKSKVINTDIKGNVKVGYKLLETSVNLPLADLKSDKGNFQFYFGPNHYHTLKEVTQGFDKNVFLGWPVINWINRFVVIPVFNFLEGFIGNYGIIIIILVILLKLLLFPLSYKSYMSMAKMKVLKPEIDAIKEKNDGDMQKTQMDTMALYRTVGINPLSGCIPMLLQMPILLAMFNFFPNSIELRQESFLWADDLSTYDAVFSWDTYIWGLSDFYGNHFSLFTFLMTISTLVYTWYNNQISTVTGPMKTVSYVMPVVFMFVLNSFPAGLSFYYFVSNIVTIVQQNIIRRFVDEEKIKNTLEDNKKKNIANPKKSRWMSRLEDAMKAKEEEMKKKKKNK